MEKLIRNLIAASGVESALQRFGPKFMAIYGPKLGDTINELIREHLPWWPF